MKKLAILLFGAFALSTSAQAAIFDFVALAAGNEHGGDPLIFVNGGVTVTATGSNTLGDDEAVAYLDEGGGLGVCSTGLDGADQCNVPSDDNVTLTEVLKLELTGANRIVDISFNDELHNPQNDDGLIDYRVGGAGAWVDSTFGTIAAALAMEIDTIFEFRIGFDLGAQDPVDQFYIASLTAVPLPAAAWLFGTAMLGLFGLRRKAKMGALAA